MKSEFILLSLVALLVLLQFQASFASQSINLSFKMDSRKINADDLPTIRGSVHDKNGIPIDNAKIQVPFAKETIETYTNENGYFEVQSSEPESVGEHMTSVLVFKEGFEPIFGSIMFEVSNKTTVLQSNNNSTDDLQNSSNQFVDPIAQILQKQIEEFQQKQDEQEKKNQEALENKVLVEQQREQAKQSLNTELKQMEKDNEYYTPRNAFLRFIQDIDSFVQGVFLDSFALTEQKTNEARQAKMDALAEGKSSVEAMKIFHKKAAISRNEIIDLNKNLNIKYNLTEPTVQNSFDEQGKIPRSGN